MQVIAIPKGHGRARKLDGTEGIDFVRCLICGKHLRVISRRHLSTHEIYRDTYMEEYRLTPDQLCAKDFRRLHSSRQDYYPHGKRDWIAAIKMIHKQHGQVFADTCKTTSHIFITRGFGFSVIGTKLCGRRDLPQSRCGCGVFGIR